MSIFEPSPWAGRMLSIVRVVIGLVFMSAGTTKLFDWPPSGMPGVPVPLMSQMGIGGLLEVVGGLAIVLGLFTRPVAFVLAGEMAVAYFQMHFPKSFFPTNNGGMAALLYCFLYLYLMVAGGGDWSVDAAILRRQRKNSVW